MLRVYFENLTGVAVAPAYGAVRTDRDTGGSCVWCRVGSREECPDSCGWELS